jgi:hypothetical protein
MIGSDQAKTPPTGAVNRTAWSRIKILQRLPAKSAAKTRHLPACSSCRKAYLYTMKL